MKTIKKQSTFFFLLGALLVSSPGLVSCKSDPSGMSDQEKESAKKEISAIEKKQIEDYGKLDFPSAMKPNLNSPDFLEINPDATYSNYDDIIKRAATEADKLAGLKLTTSKEEFRFLTKNHVLYTWFGKGEVQLKSGEKFVREKCVSTALFSKVNNQWKIIYDHGSSSAFVKEP